jgi:hypothetical protein
LGRARCDGRERNRRGEQRPQCLESSHHNPLGKMRKLYIRERLPESRRMA